MCASNIVTADLGPNVAAVIVRPASPLAAVVNDRIVTRPIMRAQAAAALTAAGLDTHQVLEALRGICSGSVAQEQAGPL